MELAEQIRVTINGPNGLAMPNYEALRRLRSLGVKRRPGRGTRSTTKSKVQAEFLAGYPAIRNLAHYRELVSDERSEGPMVWYVPGTVLLMERTEHPKSKRVYYVVLDTAIGSRPAFLKELAQRKSITVEIEPATTSP